MSYWTGARMATNARTDFDAEMAYERLPGKVYPTRKDARAALLEALRQEMLNLEDNPYYFGRLAVILADLLRDDTRDEAEYEGLRFKIWEMPEDVRGVSGKRP